MTAKVVLDLTSLDTPARDVALTHLGLQATAMARAYRRLLEV